MSYCRILWGGSDVYIFESSIAGPQGVLECCGCKLSGDDGPWTWTDVAEFLAHLHEHDMAGDMVPPGVARAIWEDWRDGEFEFADPFDPAADEPDEVHPEVMKWWNRRVIRHMHRRLPAAAQQLFIDVSEGTREFPSEEEWAKALDTEKEE